MGKETNRHNAGAERTKCNDDALREAVAVLKAVTEALEDVIAGADSMSGACKANGLDYLKVRAFLLSKNFGNCRLEGPLVPLSDAVKLDPDPHEQLYMDVFELNDIRDMQLPADFRETAMDVLGTLTEREQKILCMKYGLGGEYPMTLQEIGEEFGVQKERVRQIAAKSLRKLRHPSRTRWLEQGSIRHRAQQEANQSIIDAQQEAANAWVSEKKKEAEGKTRNPSMLDAAQVGIEELDLSVRTYNCLKRAGKNTLLDLIRMEDDDFLHVRNLGRKCTEEAVAKRDAMVLRITAG